MSPISEIVLIPFPRSEAAQVACRAVVDRFCTPKPRPRSRPETLHLADPSEYSPDRHDITGAEFDGPGRVFLYVKADSARYRFTVVKRSDRWLIDARQMWTDGWQPAGL